MPETAAVTSSVSVIYKHIMLTSLDSVVELLFIALIVFFEAFSARHICLQDSYAIIGLDFGSYIENQLCQTHPALI